MAVFTGSPSAFDNYMKRFPSEEQRKANDRKGMEAWKKWVEGHSGAIVDMGAPLGRTKRVTKDGIADVRNNLGAYTVVQAESQEDAAKLFRDHPHFTIFPGDGVEIMECLPIPQMD
jgi:hemolysin-activating ACP:hemolysin acyltransferase